MDQDSDSEVVIVGVGARTPLGLTVETTASAVRAGLAAMREHPCLVDKVGDPMVIASDLELDPDVGIAGRCSALACSAALECIEATFGDGSAPPDLQLLVALPEARPGFPAALEDHVAGELSDRLTGRARLMTVECEASGHAGAIALLREARRRVVTRAAEICLVGGVDTYLGAETLEWLDSNDQLHSSETTWGFCPGEGAGFCALTSKSIAVERSLPVLLTLVSEGSGMEEQLNRTDAVCIGAGLSTAFREALGVLPDGLMIDHTICDLNGDPYRGNEFGFAVLRAPRRFSEGSDFSTPADCWGDLGAASGPLFVVLAAMAAKRSYEPGSQTLIWASSEGGLRACAVLSSARANGEAVI